MADILGKKVGMTHIYDKSGAVVPVTVVEAGPCSVVNLRTKEKDGYYAVQLGFGQVKKINKPMEGYYKKLGAKINFEHLREFRLKNVEGYVLNQEVKVDSFKSDEIINVTATSIGKGFQGIMKRWHARGGPGAHGSKFHRLPGSSGSNTTPGRVLKGKHRAGRMGGDRVTIKNLRVVSVDPARNLLLIKGSVPGAKNSFLLIRSTGRIMGPKQVTKVKETKAQKPEPGKPAGKAKAK